NVENVLWANTVLASGRVVGVVVYTGRETRSVMNTTLPKSKVGLLDIEVNNLTKILFLFVVVLASVMVAMKGLDKNWYRYLMRFVLLFSYIIPISLRVNLDMAKLFYSWQIGRDHHIKGSQKLLFVILSIQLRDFFYILCLFNENNRANEQHCQPTVW
ncbi:unnamed protein product, partial [Gongylonema pulchrum]|uniref:P-type phospholipid transporter n=1 Tax=Gongylonema pulchrum TaxID=637853 RepID=A0A183D9D4_9BILA